MLALLPANAISYDLRAWADIAGFLASGQNPYNVPHQYLSWPPAWMQIVFSLDHLARFFGVSVTVAIRVFLILVDAVAAILTGCLIRRLTPASVLPPLLVGWSLNPIAILLVCQHGNFDGLVAICVLLMLLSLAAFTELRDSVSWLWACAWLGAGVVVKTVPIVLAPLLASGRGLSRRALALGAMLVAAPALYGLSVIYVLGPDSVRSHVLGYRGLPGWFGMSGLLMIAGKSDWIPAYRIVFAVGLASGMAWLAVRASRGITPRACVFAATTTLTIIPAFGPGYGAQYLAWSLPLLLVLWSVGDQHTRFVLVFFGTIAAATYLVDYALMSSHGAFLVAATADPGGALRRISDRLATPQGATLERLPLFGAYLVLMVSLLRATRDEIQSGGAGHHGS